MRMKVLQMLVLFCSMPELYGAQQRRVVECFSKEEKQKSAEVHMQIEQEAKEKLSEEEELWQAFGSCELARFSQSEITVAAMDAAGKILVLGDNKGHIHCCMGKRWVEYSLFEQAPSLLAVSGRYIAACRDNLLEIIEVDHDQFQQEFKLAAPLLSLATQQGNGSFVALDTKQELILFEYHIQSGIHQLTKMNKKIKIRKSDKVRLSAQGTALVVLDENEKRICLELFVGKNPIVRVIESRKPFNVAGVSPDGSVLVTGTDAELTAWKSCGAPCSFTLECAPKGVIIDNENRFIVCVSEKGYGWVCCDLQTKRSIRLPIMVGSCITGALFMPPCMQAFLIVSRSAQQKTVITAHLLTSGLLLSQAQRQLLLKIVRGAQDKRQHTVQQQEQALLTSLNPLIKQILASRYKVKV